VPNEVEITITGRDMSGPAFDSALGRMAKLRAEAKLLGADLNGLSIGNIDVNKVGPALAAMRAKIQSLGIADLADVNVPLGRLSVQMQILKRLVQQAGLSDMLGINLNTSQLEAQVRKLRNMSEVIPVTWDVSALHLPTLGAGQNISDKFSIMGLDAAAAQLSAVRAQTTLLLAAFTQLSQGKDKLSNNVDNVLTPSLRRGWGWFGALRGRTELFAGGLTALGVPAILATAGAFHIAIDAVVETLAVLIPAGIAFAAFGVAAVPTIQNITLHMTALSNTTTALNEKIFPLTGGFSKLADAVKPSVYQLFGEGLVVINHNTGLLTVLATEAGRALVQLGARSAVALTSGGLNSLLRVGPADLARIGDIIGNIFGTIGNLLHTMPGYAQTLLVILDNLTKAMEAITASPITQWIIRMGLFFHGFVLYVGLAVTASVLLGNALLSLAAKFGLVDAGMTVFNAAQFGIGIKEMVGATGLLAGEMVTLGAGEDVAAAGALVLEGAWTAITAINPIVWIAAIGAGLATLFFWLNRTTSATDAYDNAVKGALQSVPVSQLGVNIMQEAAVTTGLLANAQKQLDQTQKTVSISAGHGFAVITGTTGAYAQATAVVGGYKGELGTLQGYQSNYNSLLKAAHGNLGLLNAAGITSNQIIGASAQEMKQYIIEVQAAADAQKALALGIGRGAAAQNAQTNAWMTDGIPAMQAVTTAEDNLLTMILAGPQAFIAFQQGMKTMAAAAKVTGANISGLNSQSLTLGSDFYTTVVPAAQKLIDSLDQQGISTRNLTKVIATEAQQMLPFTQHNIEARTVLVDLINNALGPGTVSLKTLNTWIGNNSTSLKGFNRIVALSTINAGNLAGVLKNDAIKAFQQATFAASGAGGAIAIYTRDIMNGTTQTQAGKSARAQLIKDLENAGFSAQGAKLFIDKMQQSINNMKGKNVNVSVTGSAGGKLTVASQAFGQNAAGFLEFHAAGGIAGSQRNRHLPGYGGGDIIPALLEPGETVIDKHRSRQFAHLFRMMGVHGYQHGGMVDSPQVMPNWASGAEVSFATFAEKTWGASLVTALKARVAKAVGGSGAIGGDAAANRALAMHMYPNIGAANWAAWNYVAMKESGWNRFARNPGSGAYGIPQALPPTKLPFAGQAAGGSHAGPQISWMWNYMNSVYGGPQGAAAHEASQHWYDDGGWLMPGANYMYNGTGGLEHLSRDSGTRSGGRGSVSGTDQRLDKIAAILMHAPAATSAGVSQALNGASRTAGRRGLHRTRPLI
jgi:hypothetical protein